MQVFFGIVCTFLIGFKPVSRIFSYKLINVLILKNIFIKCLIKKKNLPIYFQYDTWTKVLPISESVRAGHPLRPHLG